MKEVTVNRDAMLWLTDQYGQDCTAGILDEIDMAAVGSVGRETMSVSMDAVESVLAWADNFGGHITPQYALVHRELEAAKEAK